jgi:hypothetical protein
MWLLSIKPSPKSEKRFRATFCKCKVKNECKGTNHKVVDFGQKGGSTFIDHKDEEKKKNYLARHRVREDWSDPTSAGALSRWLLWNLKTLSASITDFKKRFNL